MKEDRYHSTIKQRFAKGLVNLVSWNDPEKSPTGYALRSERLQMLNWVGNLRGKRVLDIGIASGRFVLSFAEKEADIYGVDICQEVINDVTRRLDEKGLNARLIRSDAEATPFQDNYFDIINCQQVLLHLPNKINALREIIRILKPGGILILDMTNKFGLHYLYKRAYWSLKKIKSALFKTEASDLDSVETMSNRDFFKLLLSLNMEIQNKKAFGYFIEFPLIPKAVSQFIDALLARLFFRKLFFLNSFTLVKAIKRPH
jgi:ubiquinone/menaquinone biosynthesis C-methylase UbiE